MKASLKEIWRVDVANLFSFMVEWSTDDFEGEGFHQCID